MKSGSYLFVILLIAISCNTAKDKAEKNMVSSKNYTLQVEGIKNLMPPSDPGIKSVYTIITITAAETHEHKWKFKEAIISDSEKTYTLNKFDHNTYFDKGAKQIMTNLRGIPADINDKFSIEIILIDEDEKQLVLSKENIEMTVVH